MKKIILALLALIIGLAAGFVVHAVLTPTGISTDAPAPASYDLALTGDYALSVMQKNISEDSGLAVTALQINSPCSLAVAGEVNTAALEGKVGGFTAKLISYLPETISLTLTADISADEGKLTAKVTSFSIQNLTLGEKLIPSTFKKFITEMVESAAGGIADSLGQIESIEATENTLFISMK